MTILVTGATGTVGRLVVDELVRAGRQVRALTRDSARASELLPADVEVVAGDLADPGSLVAAFDGVTAAHLITFAGDDYAPLKRGDEIVELAVKAGVRKVSVLGGRADGPLERALAAAGKHATAEHATGLEWTLLNPVEFMSNTLRWWAGSVKAHGVVREPFGDRLSALVHEADIAAVAAAVLTGEGHGGRTYTLTGPEALTTREKVRVLAEATGLDITFTELTEQEARAEWRSHGMGEETVEFLVQALGNTPEVGYTVVPTVEQVTGRPARPFAQWAAEHAAAFRP
ncbi:NmrA family NAD(P)-binding protein [Nonomuraea sp. SMC257]|uniref:NmrA family NAD(P)-binding protein n=1 Tax=Nonomuraea montanisoli TaxID=2741721 RepID=A0A7Y6IG86_9ACTN|nr:NmrA family NAD(P)-binding protein [Nonomuraea montanisoli]NUW37708.1 NmrA family NAD(P)-binding protein [Nonomuraea montanisoli]